MFVIGHLTTIRTLHDFCETLTAIQVFFGSPCYVPEMDAYAHFIETAINAQSSNLDIAPEDVNEERYEERQNNEYEVEQIVINYSQDLISFVNY